MVERWLSVGVSAEGWDAETSSPVIAHVTSADGGVDFYHAYAANGTERLLVADAGDYQVSWVTPVNADGSVYRVCEPATVTAQEREVTDGDATDGASAAESDGDAPELPYAFERVEAADVSRDDLEQVVRDVAEAVRAGDETLVGDAGVAVVSRVQENVQASPNASPSHTHNYNIPITKTVHHDAVTHVVNHPAEYQTVYHDPVVEYRHICNNCGADITGNEDSHFENSLLNGGNCGSWSTKPVTIKAGWSEDVLVKAAWSETVVDSAAWDETVTTGYVCSGCGATK